ncbi:MAG: tRNA (adenosine(37)-N6)-threonylcarbamoyltransferase complex dimerization subunit type 1 TsaB [Candidatus Atribacteria bacterium]|nr:tRNA (adenosine(37)-N6)-threonylcarbamoyltransferase complex dimerization subunit type 1 TsaB [Candidatus Atribacteria bacterium]
MLVLGIDTATKVLNLAIVNNSEVIIDYKVNRMEKTHSTLILSALNNMLNLSGIKLKEIEGIAVSIGPGSFTGLRIGLSTAKGLAFALSIPLIGVSSLESSAFSWLSLPGILCPIIKARRGEYYFALYEYKNKDSSIVKDYQCAKWVEIKQELLEYRDHIYIFGDGIEDIIKDEKIENYGHIANIYFINNSLNTANAVSVALLGEERIPKKECDDIYKLLPLYISKSAAEVLIEKDPVLIIKK